MQQFTTDRWTIQYDPT